MYEICLYTHVSIWVSCCLSLPEVGSPLTTLGLKVPSPLFPLCFDMFFTSLTSTAFIFNIKKKLFILLRRSYQRRLASYLQLKSNKSYTLRLLDSALHLTEKAVVDINLCTGK